MKENGYTTLEYYKNRDLFYLYEISFIWFDEVPDFKLQNNLPRTEVTELIQDLLANLISLNKDGDFIIQFSNLFKKETDEICALGLTPIYYQTGWLPNIGEWLPFDNSCSQLQPKIETFTFNKATSWKELIFKRDDLKMFAKNRNQQPPLLFPDIQVGFDEWVALKKVYSSNDNTSQSFFSNTVTNESIKSDKVKPISYAGLDEKPVGSNKLFDKEKLVKEIAPKLKEKYPSANTSDLIKYADELGWYVSLYPAKNGFITDCLEEAGIERGKRGQGAKPL